MHNIVTVSCLGIKLLKDDIYTRYDPDLIEKYFTQLHNFNAFLDGKLPGIIQYRPSFVFLFYLFFVSPLALWR